MMEPLLPLDEALRRLTEAFPAPSTPGIQADRDDPALDRSAMDGAALRSEDSLAPRVILGTLAEGKVGLEVLHRFPTPYLKTEAGLRWNLPVPGWTPYLTVSYQQPLARDRPRGSEGAGSLQSYLAAQGAGQELDRIWAFGVGFAF